MICGYCGKEQDEMFMTLPIWCGSCVRTRKSPALPAATAQLAIVGLPGSGKTTLAKALGPALDLWVIHTDDVVLGQAWADQAQAALAAVQSVGLTSRPDRGLIVEGITVCRLFKRGFEPDCVLWILGGDRAPHTA
jgi:hypothetical protein